MELINNFWFKFDDADYLSGSDDAQTTYQNSVLSAATAKTAATKKSMRSHTIGAGIVFYSLFPNRLDKFNFPGL